MPHPRMPLCSVPPFKGSNLEHKSFRLSIRFRNQQLRHVDRPFDAQKRRYSGLEILGVSPLLPHAAILGPIYTVCWLFGDLLPRNRAR
jgi:hypothetical protein